MKKRAYLALIALCITLTGSACGLGEQTSEPSSDDQISVDNTENTGNAVISNGFGTRLVSVDNIEKYIDLAEYKGVVLDKNLYEVTDDEVEAQIRKNLDLDKKEVTDDKEGVMIGDLVTINYVGTVGSKKLEAEDNFDLTIGESNMTEGFEEGLLGMQKGETRTIQIAFPVDFETEELSGAVVTYRVTLQNYQRTPEITDKIIASETDSANLKEYKEKVRKELEANKEAARAEALRESAWSTVLLNSEVEEYPKADIDNAIAEYKKQVMFYNNDSGMELEQFVKSQGLSLEEFQMQCQQYAERKVKQNLIIQAIMDAEGIRLDDEESIRIQEQMIEELGAGSLVELLDFYGQSLIDESIGLIRIEDYIVANAVFEEPVSENETAETETVETETSETETANAEKTSETDDGENTGEGN